MSCIVLYLFHDIVTNFSCFWKLSLLLFAELLLPLLFYFELIRYALFFSIHLSSWVSPILSKLIFAKICNCVRYVHTVDDASFMLFSFFFYFFCCLFQADMYLACTFKTSNSIYTFTDMDVQHAFPLLVNYPRNLFSIRLLFVAFLHRLLLLFFIFKPRG